MADKRPPQKTQQAKRQGILQEAWQNMMNDMDRVLPEKLHGRQGKKKFVLWLFVLEVVVIGGIGAFIYDWFFSS